MSCYINLHVGEVITLNSNIKAFKPPRTTCKTFKTKDLEQSEERSYLSIKEKKKKKI